MTTDINNVISYYPYTTHVITDYHYQNLCSDNTLADLVHHHKNIMDKQNMILSNRLYLPRNNSGPKLQPYGSESHLPHIQNKMLGP